MRINPLYATVSEVRLESRRGGRVVGNSYPNRVTSGCPSLAQNDLYEYASQWAIHPEMSNAMKGCYHLHQSHHGLSIVRNALRNIRVSQRR